MVCVQQCWWWWCFTAGCILGMGCFFHTVVAVAYGAGGAGSKALHSTGNEAMENAF